MILKADVNTLMNLTSNKLKPDWIHVLMRTSSGLIVIWRIIKVALAIIQIGKVIVRFGMRLGIP